MSYPFPQQVFAGGARVGLLFPFSSLLILGTVPLKLSGIIIHWISGTACLVLPGELIVTALFPLILIFLVLADFIKPFL